METYFTVKTDGQFELIVKKSRFICQVARVTDENSAQAFIEQVRKSIDLKQWRRPDVSSLYKKQLVVFEGQLSTTFLNVIIDRKIFYQDNNA